MSARRRPDAGESDAPTESPHEPGVWVSFADPDEDRTWLVDVGFLASSWRCVYGSTCQGVLTGPASELVEGCCSYGAHFSDDEDAARVEKVAGRLTTEQWQFASVGRARGVVKTHGKERTTRLVADACIFLNRPGFAGGPGCALHRLALEEGSSPLAAKPDVCWQLPLRREDAVDALGHVTSTLRRWERRHWGPAGEEFHWWCTEDPEAFIGAVPVYVSLAEEITALTSPALYTMLVPYMEKVLEQRAVPVRLRRPQDGSASPTSSSSSSSDS